MSQDNQRRVIAAKGKPVTIDSKAETFALDFITTATTGTFAPSGNVPGLRIDVNGTAYRIPLYSV